MKEMNVNEVMKLVKTNGKPAISIYLRTDHHEPGGTSKIKSNLQRLYKTIEDMIARTYDGKTKERILDPLKRSISALKLGRQRGGLAIFHSDEFTGMVKIPTPTRDLAVAAESYHLKPVLRCMQLRRKFYLLALRKRHAELFLVTPDGPRRLERVEVFARPEKLEDGLETLKNWTNGRLRIKKQKDILLAMESLNRRLEVLWVGERLPLLVAGAHQYQDAFRKTCNNANLLDRGLSMQIDALDQNTLMGLANHFMEQHYALLDDLAVVSFRKARISGLTSTNLKEISQAAAQGQIKSLLIAEDQHLWGHLDRLSGTLQLIKQKTDARSDDVLDDIAEMTILKGGQVTVLPSFQMPEGASIAAVLFWSSTPEANQAHRVYRTLAKPIASQPPLQITA
jgi:hypothetical protein